MSGQGSVAKKLAALRIAKARRLKSQVVLLRTRNSPSAIAVFGRLDSPFAALVQVPVDAVITWGSAAISTQHITGEPNPVTRQPGYDAPAGAICHDSAIVLTAARPASESTIARIAELTRRAQVQWLPPELRPFFTQGHACA